MKAVILAGGKGTRLRGVIDDVPKPMAPVGGKPFLEYLLLQLHRWGFRDIILSVCYKRSIIKSYFGDGKSLGLRIRYCEETVPLGTGGALKKAISMNDDTCFLVMNGDSFFGINFTDFVLYHEKKSAMATISLAVVPQRGRYGGVEINEDGAIIDFTPKGMDTAGLINGGIYLVRSEIINYIPEGKISLEGQVFSLLKKDGRLYGKTFDAFFLDMGVPDDYYRICRNPEKLNNAPLLD